MGCGSRYHANPTRSEGSGDVGLVWAVRNPSVNRSNSTPLDWKGVLT